MWFKIGIRRDSFTIYVDSKWAPKAKKYIIRRMYILALMHKQYCWPFATPKSRKCDLHKSTFECMQRSCYEISKGMISGCIAICQRTKNKMGRSYCANDQIMKFKSKVYIMQRSNYERGKGENLLCLMLASN